MDAESSSIPEVTEGAEVVLRAREGDPEAREQLTRHFSGLLESVIRVRMGKRLQRYATPEDVAQEALLSALGALDCLREGAGYADFKAILLRNAEWRLINLSRKSDGFVPQSEVLAEGSAADRAISMLSRGPVTAADDRDWLQRQIDRLDEKYASVLRLHLSGKSFPEIAQELELLEDTARKRYFRAADKLRLLLAAED